jgi:hypothetical protein
MELLDQILARFCREHGLENALTDDEVRALAYKHIDPDLSQFVKGVWIEGNMLIIQCTEPVAVQEFQIRAEGLRMRINREAGRAALAGIRLTLYRSRKPR